MAYVLIGCVLKYQNGIWLVGIRRAQMTTMDESLFTVLTIFFAGVWVFAASHSFDWGMATVMCYWALHQTIKAATSRKEK